MKLLYIAALPIELKRLGGVPKKVFTQLKALSTAFDCELIYTSQGDVRLYSLREERERTLAPGGKSFHVLRAAKTLVEQGGYDALYIRYPLSSPDFLRLCAALRRKGLRFVVEIPTYPYDREGRESLKGRLIHLVDRVFRTGLKRYVDRLVTFSGDETIFGIQTIRTINGMDFDSLQPDNSPVDPGETLTAIAVSAMYTVHGYDRFIKGLHEYYQSGGERNIVLRLVGAGDKYGEYRALAARCGLGAHVEFPGTLLGEELDAAYRGCAVGVNSLAIHRQKLEFESTLKTREYAAKGLPILSSSYVDALSEEGNRRYTLRVPPDESPVDMRALLRFTDTLYARTALMRLRAEIREDGKQTCDIHITMEPVLAYLKP